jgi:hypothetical protein
MVYGMATPINYCIMYGHLHNTDGCQPYYPGLVVGLMGTQTSASISSIVALVLMIPSAHLQICQCHLSPHVLMPLLSHLVTLC